MKALFIGGYNRYTVSLLGKLSKNGISLAVLNNEPKDEGVKIQHAKYTVEMRYAGRVFDSYRPDIVLVTAAYDEADFLDDLKEVLTQAVLHKLKRMIFLSSLTVYGSQPNDGSLPAEAEPLHPTSRQGLRFAAGEDLCRRWESSSGMKVTILRVSGIYGKGISGDMLDKMLASLLNGENVVLPQHALFAPLHVEDFAEAVMQVVEAGYSPAYNISSTETIAPQQLQWKLQLLLQAQQKNAPSSGFGQVLLEEGQNTDCNAADNRLFKNEYQWHERRDFNREAADLTASIHKNLRREAKRKARELRRQQRSESSGMNLLALIEMSLLFALTIYLTKVQGDLPLVGNVNFVLLFLVIVVVSMSLQQSAIALMMICGLLVFEQMEVGYDLFSSIVNNNTLLKAAEYCIVGISVSYAMQRLKIRAQFLQLELDEHKNEMLVLEQFSDDNLRTRHFFEDQILEYEVSLPRVIDMTARLDALEPQKILPETIDILAETIGVDDVAAYIVGSRGGRLRLSFAKTEEAMAMGQSPRLDDYSEMLEDLENDRVYVNRSLTPNYPAMATGVSIDGKLSLVFVVWNIPFNKMRLDTSNLLQAITRLVSAALRRSYQYEELTRGERYVDGTNVMKAEAFNKLMESRQDSKWLFRGLMVRIVGDGDLRVLADKVSSLVRENDYMGLDENGNLLLLLSGTSMEGYKVFEGRLAKIGLSSVLVGKDS